MGVEEENQTDDIPSSRLKRYVGCVMLFMKKERLIIAVFTSVILGFIVGISINQNVQSMGEPDKTTLLVVLGFPGELLVRMLRMLVLPLIVCSLIVGLAGLEKQASGRVGRRAVLYYLTTTLIAAVLGLLIVVIIQPGKNASIPTSSKKLPSARTLDSFLDILRNMFPDNIVQACFQQAKTSVRTVAVPSGRIYVNFTALSQDEIGKLQKVHVFKTEVVNQTTNYNRTYYINYRQIQVAGPVVYTSGQNFVGLVVFSIAVGLVTATLGEDGKPLLKFVDAMSKVVSRLIKYVMWYSPFGIWSLLAVSFARMDNIASTFESLGLLVLCVLLGEFLHSLCIYPAIYFAFIRKNPYKFMKGLLQPLLTAFGTSSSAATLPVTMKCLEEKQKIDKRVVRFIVPIGATVNMDGGALYLPLACIFLAQAYQYELDFGKYIAISLSAIMTSIGVAGLPAVAPVGILIVIQAAGLPPEAVSLVFAIDWFLDRFKTTVNVCGDCFGAAVVAHLSRKELQNKEMIDENAVVINKRNEEKGASLLSPEISDNQSTKML